MGGTRIVNTIPSFSMVVNPVSTTFPYLTTFPEIHPAANTAAALIHRGTRNEHAGALDGPQTRGCNHRRRTTHTSPSGDGAGISLTMASEAIEGPWIAAEICSKSSLDSFTRLFRRGDRQAKRAW